MAVLAQTSLSPSSVDTLATQTTVADASAHVNDKSSDEASTRQTVSHPSPANDQLSIAKTCVHLWELAYPMVYDRIIFNISSAIEDKVWSNLASGIGLRYVRHLEIHTSIQSNAYGWVPDHIADMIVGTLLAGLRRNQLLSFSLKTSACVSFTMSTKNVIILLETQRKLTRHPIKADEQKDLLADKALSEELVSDAILSVSEDGGSTLDSHTLLYLAVAFHSGVSSRTLSDRNSNVIKKGPGQPKTILTLQPKQVSPPADLVKGEIIARYAKDNYYFLEAYVDTISAESRISIQSRKSNGPVYL
ncbi:hypothetical protein BKA58DRAFT_467824 [Alternaria rosae]|uniref:uncharacterized protein n=1 Tax=Alternaria rosae TaxID=1187941 RepID=UPI001E8D8D20|nr:uncharacterized protein BKA58DRAFT_467824 [Alternaria rosae]KAH6876140.1 hypothetical protein BKA58DRAFT_467824 [Alternaria rosae]